MSAAAPSTNPAPQHCPNCGSAQIAAYCAACGQDQRDPIRSFAHWVQEYLGDSFSFDSRLIRSLLPLLGRPGQLSREFVSGRRARYIPPLRAYLFISVLYFVLAAMAPDYSGAIVADQPDAAGVELRTEIRPDDGPLMRWVAERGQKIEANPVAFEKAVADGLPMALFLCLPLIAGWLALLTAGRGHWYIEHLVFCLHLHSAFFLIGILQMAVLNLGVSGIGLSLFNLWFPAYLLLALRRAYALSWSGAAWRAVALGIFGYLLSGGAVFVGFVLLMMARLP